MSKGQGVPINEGHPFIDDATGKINFAHRETKAQRADRLRHKQAMQEYRHAYCARLLVIGPRFNFFLYFYGLQARDLQTVPCFPLYEALKRRGIAINDGGEFTSSLFWAEDIRPKRRRNPFITQIIGENE